MLAVELRHLLFVLLFVTPLSGGQNASELAKLFPITFWGVETQKQLIENFKRGNYLTAVQADNAKFRPAAAVVGQQQPFESGLTAVLPPVRSQNERDDLVRALLLRGQSGKASPAGRYQDAAAAQKSTPVGGEGALLVSSSSRRPLGLPPGSLELLKRLPAEQQEQLLKAYLSSLLSPVTVDKNSGSFAVGTQPSPPLPISYAPTTTTAQQIGSPTKPFPPLFPRRSQVPAAVTPARQFGAYCGALHERFAPGGPSYHNCRGAVWALDDSNLIVSQFSFQPNFFKTENITFWAGPNQRTNNGVMDMFPSINGMYLFPSKFNHSSFASLQSDEVIIAKRPNASEVAQILRVDSTGGGSDEPKSEAETKSISEPEPTAETSAGRRKRTTDFFPPKWTGKLYEDEDHQKAEVGSITRSLELLRNRNRRRPVLLVVSGGRMAIPPSSARGGAGNFVRSPLSTNLFAVDENGASENFLPTLPPRHSAKLLAEKTSSTTTATSTSTTAARTTPSPARVVRAAEPLGWYSGLDTVALKLPAGRKVSDVDWISVWDHNRNSSVASVLIPNGAGFRIPHKTLVRGLKSTGFKKIGSGPIEILDTKTVVVKDFYFEGDAPGAWFMAGKGLLPSPFGRIIPIYRSDAGASKFDCNFLQPYAKQDVTLKLPADMEITDVFWLSVFCVPFGISFAHTYIPYNDLTVPIDMTGVKIPTCALEPRQQGAGGIF